MNEIVLTKGVKVIIDFNDIQNESDLADAIAMSSTVLAWKNKMTKASNEVSDVTKVPRKYITRKYGATLDSQIIKTLETQTDLTCQEITDRVNANFNRGTKTSIVSVNLLNLIEKNVLQRKKVDGSSFMYSIKGVDVHA